MDVDALRQCTRCALALTRQRVVVGSGPTAPRLLIVGEAPGQREDEGGEPFVGRSGRLLFALLESELGLARESCFVTNVVKCRPPANRTPTAHEVATCRPWLEEQLREISPGALLTLGLVAARAVLSLRAPLREQHGRVVFAGATPGLATYHPAAALRGGSSVVDVMRSDLAALRPYLERP